LEARLPGAANRRVTSEPRAARIEPLTAADVEPLSALAREIWYAHYPAIISTAQIEYMLDQRYRAELVRAELRQDALWWDKLVIGEQMAGFASYFLTQVAGEMKLDKIYVHPRHQRHGYGGLMIARACDAYITHGFRVADAVTKDIGGGFVMDDYIMVKPLE
jgi:GNAT superfamily N-acetyltransferase